jgi:sigma54-dependent transcription regulator
MGRILAESARTSVVKLLFDAVEAFDRFGQLELDAIELSTCAEVKVLLISGRQRTPIEKRMNVIVLRWL